MSTPHRFLKIILPETLFEKIKAGTKLWLLECPCGHKRDLWNAGGLRYKAVGEKRQYLKCPECGKGTWHKVRMKTEVEKGQI